MQLLGRRSVHSHKCTVRKSGSFQVSSFCFPPQNIISLLQGSHMHTTHNTDIAELCRHRLGQHFFFSFLSQTLSFQSGEDTMDRFCLFPSGQMSIKRPKLFFSFSSTTPPTALGRNTPTQGQGPGEKSSGHAIPSLPLLSSWGTGRGHNHLSGRDFISYKCSFPVPRLRKASLHRTIL